MNNIFNQVSISKPKKNVFDLSHEKKLSLNMGDLVPVLLQEVIPGDKLKCNSEMLMRLAPMLSPVMHRCNAYMHFFHVPYRLLYDEFESFITGGENGLANPTFPTFEVKTANKHLFLKGSLADYLGVPTTDGLANITQNAVINALPFRAYHLIYNEYYRDQNLTAKVAITKNSTVSDDELGLLLQLRKRAWEKDYFTSALPWAQRGGEVNLPVDSTVNYKPASDIFLQVGGGATGAVAGNGGTLEAGGNNARIENIDSIDNAITINDLRRSVKLQQWLEKNARAGSRYIEQILSHFGVVSSNKLLQRPQYLGGGKSPIVISEVLQTSKTDVSPQGNMAGHGLSVGNTNEFTHYFEEHGFVIGILSVLPRTCYQQGVPKILLKTNKFDYFWPEFANLGEQEVLNSELYHDYTGATPKDGPFGYQSRYSEYKFAQSSVHGDFKDNLAFWHMGRIFAAAPGLNTSFIEANPSHRIFANTDPAVHKLYCQIYHDIKAIRPMPYFGTPTL